MADHPPNAIALGIRADSRGVSGSEAFHRCLDGGALDTRTRGLAMPSGQLFLGNSRKHRAGLHLKKLLWIIGASLPKMLRCLPPMFWGL